MPDSKASSDRRGKKPVGFDPVTFDQFSSCVIGLNYNSMKIQVVAWTKGQRHLASTRLVMAQQNGGVIYLAIPKDADTEKLWRAIEDEAIERIMMRLSFPTDWYFIVVEPRREMRESFHFRVTDKLFKVQRRRTFRLPVPEHWLMRAKWEGYEMKVMDVSMGGMRLWVLNEELEKNLKSGQILSELRFNLRGRELRASVEVRHIQSVQYSRLRKGSRVGVMFSHMSEEDKAFLSAALLEESSKYYGRLP
jgi:c-di-GMP-binding flagellar brake protein YcgR